MTNFEEKYYVDRRGTNCAKWDGAARVFKQEGLLPFWVADMDFRCPDSVREAMLKMAEFNLYGYGRHDDAFDQAFIAWEKKRHSYEVKPEWMRFSPGVVAGIYRFIGAFTQKGDACIILSPCYYPFMEAIKDSGCRLITSMLINDGGRYSVDFEDFERKIIDENVKVFVLCSPMNPVGRVWTREELERLVDICRRHGVLIISDEIHHDILMNGRQHIPTLSIPGAESFTVMLTAASKTFNMAGLTHSIAVIPDDKLRARFDEYSKTMHLGGGTPGYTAIRAAYEGGEQWLDELLEFIAANAEYASSQFAARLPKAVVSPLEGTYLLWVDLAAYVKDYDELRDVVQKRCGLAVDYGRQFLTQEDGKDDLHIRINLATSRKNMEIFMERLIAELNK